MLLNSYQFLLYFFPLTAIAYFLFPAKLRLVYLLGVSALFLFFFGFEHLLIAIVTISVNYIVGLLIAKFTGRIKRYLLIVGILFNLLFLGWFKYSKFFISQLSILLSSFHLSFIAPSTGFILPVGISFYTFQFMSYLIEVYRGRETCEKNIGNLGLYTLFYPRILAGPIERSNDFIKQLYTAENFDYRRIVSGLRIMLWGLFKKVVIANRLAFFVNHVYKDVYQMSGISLLFAAYFFTYQIYCDFSGYIDMARGIAKIFGITLTDNFNRPFVSKTVPEFWRRWHITLSRWFREYVFIPLGIGMELRWDISIIIVFLLTGLWHGAGWTFIIFGLLHGIFIVVTIWWKKNIWKHIVRYVRYTSFFIWISMIQRMITFHLVAFAFIFFRSDSIQDAFHIVGKIATIPQELWFHVVSLGVLIHKITMGQPLSGFVLVLLFVCIMEYGDMLRYKQFVFDSKPIWMRWGIYYLLIATIIIFGDFFTRNGFIYIQF